MAVTEGVLKSWLAAKSKLTKAAEAERAARAAVIDEYFIDVVDGSLTLDLDKVGKLSLTRPKTYKLCETELDYVLEELTEVEKIQLITWKPSLNVNAYNKADSDVRKTIDKAVTLTYGAAQLKFTPPKSKGK